MADRVDQMLQPLTKDWGAGQRVALLVGSRGIARLSELVEAVVEFFRARGHAPFLVPAMGSHGGATAEGQEAVLRDLGLDPGRLKVPWETSLSTVVAGYLKDGRPVYMASAIERADKVIAINRVKLHTSFRGSSESGIVKMLALGLGKQLGAQTLHSQGYEGFSKALQEAASVVLQHIGPDQVLGIGLVEDAHKEIAEMKAGRGLTLFEMDMELLGRARELFPSIPIRSLDVLAVVTMGKNISGLGMDPNVTGRFSSDYATGGVEAGRLVALRLSPESHGNAIGLGLADMIPLDLLKSVDWSPTYTNAYTSGAMRAAKVPMVFGTEKDTLAAAMSMPLARTGPDSRIAVIRDTLHLETLWLSEPLWSEAEAAGLLPDGDARDLGFDSSEVLQLW